MKAGELKVGDQVRINAKVWDCVSPKFIDFYHNKIARVIRVHNGGMSVILDIPSYYSGYARLGVDGLEKIGPRQLTFIFTG